MQRILASWFGMGLLRPAPGTWGSAGAVACWLCAWWLWRFAWQSAGMGDSAAGSPNSTPSALAQAIALSVGTLAATAAGVPLGRWSIAHLMPRPDDASRSADPPHGCMGEHAGNPASEKDASADPSSFVLDEVAGQWLALAFVPAETPSQLFGRAVCAFAFFRLFDIAKPWPCRRLERLPHGWGICADDLAAGVYAGAASWAIVWAIG